MVNLYRGIYFMDIGHLAGILGYRWYFVSCFDGLMLT